MRRWQYFVAGFVLIGCSRNPVPEDSYYISQTDYQPELEDTVNTDIPFGSCFFTFLEDSLSISADSIAVDSLQLLPDSMAVSQDSLDLPVDSLSIPDSMSEWLFAEIEIQGSLYQSLSSVSAVDSDVLGAHCVRYLVWGMNPWHGFMAGDSVSLLFNPAPGQRENMVMAFQYTPAAGSSNEQFSGYVFTKTGDNWPSIWKADGSELIRLLDRMPIRTFEEITSMYGEPRGDHTHQGVDYKAPEGTPVFSVTGGTVVRTNWNSSYNGNCVEIDFGGYTEMFLHMNSIEDGVVPGALIEPGTKVGTVGSTGISTAPHLHYQINGSDGYSIDPYLYFGSHRRALGSDDMGRFQEYMDQCRLMMDN
jgi:hypothetical protein